MNKNGMIAAVAAAAGLGAPQAEDLSVDAGFIAQHFPDTAKALREEGAEAEHQRLAAIDAAHMPGHEAIITAHKADRGKSGADAALAVIGAEKTRLAGLSDSLAEDEKRMAGLRSSTGEVPNDKPAASNPIATAREMAREASVFSSEQAALGRPVSAVEAIAHISRKG